MSDTEDGFEGGAENLMIDLNEIADAPSFEVMPRGNYECEIEEMEFKFSSNNNPMWAIVLVVTQEGDYNGRKLFTNFVFSEKALPYTKQTLAAIKPELLDSPFDLEESAANQILQGVAVIARVDITEYQGEKQNSVKRLRAGNVGDGFIS